MTHVGMVPQKSLEAETFHIRLMDCMMKILLPACFIAFKLTGTFIDFMLGLSNSDIDEAADFGTAEVRDSNSVTNKDDGDNYVGDDL